MSCRWQHLQLIAVNGSRPLVLMTLQNCFFNSKVMMIHDNPWEIGLPMFPNKYTFSQLSKLSICTCWRSSTRYWIGSSHSSQTVNYNACLPSNYVDLWFPFSTIDQIQENRRSEAISCWYVPFVDIIMVPMKVILKQTFWRKLKSHSFGSLLRCSTDKIQVSRL